MLSIPALALLLACGGEPEPSGPAAARPPPPLSLTVRGEAHPGRPLPLELSGGDAELTVWRYSEPREYLEAHPDADADAREGRLPLPPPGEGEAGLALVWRGRVASGQRPRLPPAGPGLYVAEARREGERVRAALTVFDLAVVVRRSPAEILAFVVDAKRGLPAPGVPVLLTGSGVRKEGRTDAGGVFRTAAKGHDPLRLLAGDAGRLAPPVALSPSEGLADGTVRVFLETDRPLYAPGETVRYRGVVREWSGSRYRPGSLEEVRSEVRDEAGRLLAEGEPVRIRGGAFTGEFPLPGETTPGRARIEIHTSSGTHSVEFDVARRGAPSVELSLTCEPAAPRLGDTVRVRVRAVDRFGRPKAGATVHYSVVYAGTVDRPRKPEPVTVGQGLLDAEGSLLTRFDATRSGTFRMRAEILSDEVRRVREEIEVAIDPPRFHLKVEPESLHCAPGETVEVRVRARFPRSDPADLVGELEIGDEVLPFSIPAGATEGTVVRVSPPGAGSYRIEARARDAEGREARDETRLRAYDEAALSYEGGGIEVVADRTAYRPGERAHLVVLLPSVLEGARLLVTLEGNGLGVHSVEEVEGCCHRFDLEVPGNLGEELVCRVIAVRGERARTGFVRLSVSPGGRRLVVRIHAEPETVLPGSNLDLRVSVETPEGEPVSGTASLTVYDAALEGAAAGGGPRVEECFAGRRNGTLSWASSVPGLSLGPPDPAPPGARDEGARGSVLTDRGESSRLWEPHLPIGPDGVSAVYRIPRLPDRPARWRVRASFASPDARVGTGTALVMARAPVSLRPSLPPFLVTGDTALLRVAARCDRGEPVEGRLTLEARGLSGPVSREVHLVPGGADETLEVRVTAGPPGSFGVRCSLTGTTVLQREESLVVLPRHERKSRCFGGTLTRGRGSAILALPAGTPPDRARLTLRLDLGPLFAVLHALPTLDRGPHPSSEQTVHRFAPAAAARARLTSLDLTVPDGVRRSADLAPRFVTRLRSLVREDGGWGWWREEASDLRATVLVLRGLLAAREAEIAVPDDLVSTALGFLRTALDEESLRERTVEAALAIRLLVRVEGSLPAAGEILLSPAARANLPPAAAAHLLVACLTAGRAEEASLLLSRLRETMREDPEGGVGWGDGGPRSDTTVAATSAALLAFLRIGEEGSREIAERAARHLLRLRRGPAWGSTARTADACFALLELAGSTAGSPPTEMLVRLRMAGAIVKNLRLSPGDSLLGMATVEVPPHLLVSGRNQITFDVGGEGRVGWTAVLSYPGGVGPAAARTSGLDITRSVRAPSRRPCRRGDLLAVTATVVSEIDRGPVVVDCPFPAGAEPLHDPPEGGSLPVGAHMEILRDRVRFFLPRLPAGRTDLDFAIRAVHTGRYRARPATVRVVGSPRLRARSPDEPPLYIE